MANGKMIKNMVKVSIFMQLLMKNTMANGIMVINMVMDYFNINLVPMRDHLRIMLKKVKVCSPIRMDPKLKDFGKRIR